MKRYKIRLCSSGVAKHNIFDYFTNFTTPYTVSAENKSQAVINLMKEHNLIKGANFRERPVVYSIEEI